MGVSHVDLEIKTQLGGTYDWNSGGMGVSGLGFPEGTDKSVKACMHKLMTLLTIVQSRIQDKHQSIRHVFVFIYRKKNNNT